MKIRSSYVCKNLDFWLFFWNLSNLAHISTRQSPLLLASARPCTCEMFSIICQPINFIHFLYLPGPWTQLTLQALTRRIKAKSLSMAFTFFPNFIPFILFKPCYILVGWLHFGFSSQIMISTRTGSMLCLCFHSQPQTQFLTHTRNSVKLIWTVLIVLSHWHSDFICVHILAQKAIQTKSCVLAL